MSPMPPMPPMPPPGGPCGGPSLTGASVMIASDVVNNDDTLAASNRAVLTTCKSGAAAQALAGFLRSCRHSTKGGCLQPPDARQKNAGLTVAVAATA